MQVDCMSELVCQSFNIKQAIEVFKSVSVYDSEAQFSFKLDIFCKLYLKSAFARIHDTISVFSVIIYAQ